MGTPLPPPQKGGGGLPKFSVHLYCDQTARCIKMQLGTEVGLHLRDIVFDVDPATPRKRAHPPHPIFNPCLLGPNGWMDEDAAWYRNRPRSRPHCTRRGPSSRERGTAAPLFSADVYCGHGRPSQPLLSSCWISFSVFIVTWSGIYVLYMLIWPWRSPRSRSLGDDRQPPSRAFYLGWLISWYFV